MSMSRTACASPETVRFAFGANWQRFLEVLDDERIQTAEDSLKDMLGVDSLEGKTFLDAGSGSGLFSLVARRLRSKVTSFDVDPQSVACTRELKRRYFADDTDWMIDQGSALDSGYLRSLGCFDVVYSWGVLHHTGAMQEAMGNIVAAVKPGGLLFLAIYNDQGRRTKRWLWVKRAYTRLPRPFSDALLWVCLVRLWGPTILRDALQGNPMRNWRGYRSARGMSPWHDVVDWVGGYPFEVAKPEQIFDFYRRRGFVLERLKTCAGGIGCNEFVFSLPIADRQSP